MTTPHLEGTLDDNAGRRFVDSTGRNFNLWDAAHNATALTRREFAEWAEANIEGDDWCAFLFGPDQHGGRFDHVSREWVPT